MNRNLQAYKSASKATMSGRKIEAEALTNAATKLQACQDSWGEHPELLDEALKYNQKIWCVLQSELLDKNNPLPHDLKQDLLSLSAFVDKRIFETMAFPAPEKLTILIKINTNIAAGLQDAPKENLQEKPIYPKEKTVLAVSV